jgi:cell division transport system permease protein
MMSVIPHIIRRALRSLWENLYLNSVSTGVISAALLLMGMSLWVQHNINTAVESWSRDVQVSAYFQPDLPEADREAIRDRLARDPNVERVHYVTEEEAREWLTERVEGMEDLFEELGPGVLPVLLEITLVKGGNPDEQLAAIQPWLRAEEFAEVDYGREWLARFETFLQVVKGLGATMGTLILVSALFLVTNTVYLVIYNRRDELEIQKLVGATTGYIVAPFIVEGFFHGLVGSVVATAALWGAHSVLASQMQSVLTLGLVPSLTFLPVGWVVGLCFTGLVLGVGAATVAVTRFIASAP